MEREEGERERERESVCGQCASAFTASTRYNCRQLRQHASLALFASEFVTAKPQDATLPPPRLSPLPVVGKRLLLHKLITLNGAHPASNNNSSNMPQIP